MKNNTLKLIIGIALVIYAFVSFEWDNPKYNGYFPYSNSEILGSFFGSKLFFLLPGAYFILFSFPQSRTRNIFKWVLNSFVVFLVLVIIFMLSTK